MNARYIHVVVVVVGRFVFRAVILYGHWLLL